MLHPTHYGYCDVIADYRNQDEKRDLDHKLETGIFTRFKQTGYESSIANHTPNKDQGATSAKHFTPPLPTQLTSRQQYQWAGKHQQWNDKIQIGTYAKIIWRHAKYSRCFLRTPCI